jgi:hypothetical protein
VETVTQRLPLFALKFYQPMRDAIFVEKSSSYVHRARRGWPEHAFPRIRDRDEAGAVA